MAEHDNRPSVFISHNHADKDIADALKVMIEGLFKQPVGVMYSTSKELDSGIAKGGDWVRWIETQVRQARVALILLTPSSVQKPWVLWEAGAVQGAALATEGADQRRVIPIKFKLGADEVPSPFARSQVTDGLSRVDMQQFLSELVDDFARLLTGFRPVEAGTRMEGLLTAYLEAVERALLFTPMMVTEAAVQEWLTRLGELEDQGRYSETEQLHDWMNVAFGREDSEGKEDALRPIDPRLHRRLGSLYLKANKPSLAARQYELARRFAPRDIFVMRNLGKAYLDQKRYAEAGKVIEAIEQLDKQAFVRNAENAALKARWFREQDLFERASAILKEALDKTPDSYYLADLLAQVALEQDNPEEARKAYRQVLALVERSKEVSVWARASALTAAVALGDDSRALTLAGQLHDMHPKPDQSVSIDRGLSLVGERLGVMALVERVRACLRGSG